MPLKEKSWFFLAEPLKGKPFEREHLEGKVLKENPQKESF